MNTRELTKKLKAFFKRAGKKKAVIGISGGVDSSLVLWLCTKACGAKNVYAYHLPYRNGEDEKDARNWAEACGAHYKLVPIKKAASAIIRTTRPADRVAKGNILARTRMVMLYDFARQHDALVVGTGNKSELSASYFTKHGDGATDVIPLGGLYKTEVWRIAREAGVPEKIINKTPTAGLWPGQTDEGEIGLRYVELDGILALLEKGKRGQAARKFGAKKVEKVARMKKNALHKLKPAPVL
ncbi:NAD+ synthase [Candidatus Micrarchaeota archaeon]|nr:NAD+ synthase [Candidatus Micrarchaeota archaeon]